MEQVEVMEEVQPLKEVKMMSDTVGKLAEALSKAQSAMSNGKKNTAGYNYKYMTLDALTDIIRPHLGTNNLAVVQSHAFNKVGKPTVTVETLLMHSSGEWLKSILEIPIVEMKSLSFVQRMGVAMTYGRRYVLQSLFMIASEEDTDGN